MSTFYTRGNRCPEAGLQSEESGLVLHMRGLAPGGEHQVSWREKHWPLRRSQVNRLKVKITHLVSRKAWWSVKPSEGHCSRPHCTSLQNWASPSLAAQQFLSYRCHLYYPHPPLCAAKPSYCPPKLVSHGLTAASPTLPTDTCFPELSTHVASWLCGGKRAVAL